MGYSNLSFTEQLSVSIFGVCGYFGHSRVPLLKPRGHMCSFVEKKSRNVCFEERSSWRDLHRDCSQATPNPGKGR